MSDAVLLEQKGMVAILTINKPKANQLSHDVFETMRKYLDTLEIDNNIRVLVITGSGDKIFCAGADLSQGFGDFSAVDFLKRGQDIWNKIEDYPKPVIAAINGHALGGGCELSMACHIRIMKKGARIGLTETNLGIMPGYGGTLRLPRLVGRAKALEMILFGKQLEADEALALGLVHRVYDEGYMDEVMKFAEELTNRPPLSIKAILKVMSAGPSMSPEMHLKMEREELAKLFTTKDCMEGMMAFAQKRKPEFKGE
ncbi:MAG TPA: enoyl-CoA hydratase/isomerase family protein [Spirochaetota bacterium]|jgi:enoyl-CoA hydratase/carnithine racemase|nr:enoyl-CoA hydratase/isomerase family protein [Spirochaetota bacterium]HOM86445.1 enoyl-CoA hydratase/isomerase family protein [Spirochaetota bacterium]HOR93493.1 enoyl-CoA hydratase/isomerase family protein [Spirochaetota bacterium]HPD04204.1 enoyl-CoA hydratase/isomerase family protein [Spirochaetota bacterium]HPK43484.1 enoyl-CoA hydratase/isomerase family protein [Spirochaetota bacterium]